MTTYKYPLPTATYLRTIFRYDPETGGLYWQNPTHARCTKGAIKPRKDGYVWVCLDGRNYAAHRVIWAMQTGDIPQEMEVDHINHIRSDNRWANLQLLTPADNQRKKPAKYKTRPLDQRKPRKVVAVKTKSGKWQARGWDHINQKRVFLGTYSTREEALNVKF